MKKVTEYYPEKKIPSISEIIYTQNKYDLDALYSEYPEVKDQISSNGKDKRLGSSCFKITEVFSEQPPEEEHAKILGLIWNKRTYRYIPLKFLDEHINLNRYKVILPKSNGSGALGEVLSSPLIGQPSTGYTFSFISVGSFDNEAEAEAALKYIKSKFARAMLGILKVTQDNLKNAWAYVPIQDFTENSDIDWTKSISDIDQQLYKKYGLSPNEIDFIETHVKEME